jgi:YD repeat-containing protein
LTVSIDPLGNSTATYDASGLPLTTTDPRGAETETEYNIGGLGFLLELGRR